MRELMVNADCNGETFAPVLKGSTGLTVIEKLLLAPRSSVPPLIVGMVNGFSEEEVMLPVRVRTPVGVTVGVVVPPLSTNVRPVRVLLPSRFKAALPFRVTLLSGLIWPP